MQVKARTYVRPYLSPSTCNVFTQFVPRQQPTRVKLINTFALIVVDNVPSGLLANDSHLQIGSD